MGQLIGWSVRVLVAVLAAGVTCGLMTAPAQADDRVRLGGVSVRLEPGTRQVVTVNQRSGYHARVTYWHKGNGRWHKIRSARDGRIGYGGIVRRSKRKQGTGTTPLGTYTLTESFGNHRKLSSIRIPFRRVRAGDYWVQDNASRYYNTLRNKSRGGFRWWLPASNKNGSERLRDYRSQYRWSVVVDFNRPPNAVRHRGSGIFLHVNGKGATAGCVSAPRTMLGYLIRRLKPKKHPAIAIGR